MTTGSLALIIFFAILVQSVIAALVWLHSRRRQLRRPDSDTGQPQTSPKLKSSKTSLAWDGFQEFVVIRRVMEDSAASVCSLYLAATAIQTGPVSDVQARDL